jgi:hypothetical protein
MHPLSNLKLHEIWPILKFLEGKHHEEGTPLKKADDLKHAVNERQRAYTSTQEKNFRSRGRSNTSKSRKSVNMVSHTDEDGNDDVFELYEG